MCIECPDESGIILPMYCYNQLSSGGPVVIIKYMGPIWDPCMIPVIILAQRTCQ